MLTVYGNFHEPIIFSISLRSRAFFMCRCVEYRFIINLQVVYRIMTILHATN